MATVIQLRRARRVCLKCDQTFWSSGPGNRICRRCTSINNHYMVSEKVLAGQRGAKRHNGKLIDPLDVPSPA